MSNNFIVMSANGGIGEALSLRLADRRRGLTANIPNYSNVTVKLLRV